MATEEGHVVFLARGSWDAGTTGTVSKERSTITYQSTMTEKKTPHSRGP